MTDKTAIKRLPDGELAVMRALWSESGPMSAPSIAKKMAGQRSWALSSLMTVLQRLVKKGFISCQKSDGHNIYAALIAEEDYRQAESSAFLSRLYDNSLTQLVSTLYQARSVDATELAELRQYLDGLKGGER